MSVIKCEKTESVWRVNLIRLSASNSPFNVGVNRVRVSVYVVYIIRSVLLMRSSPIQLSI